MATLTVTPEGTLTVPREFVMDLGVKPGDQLQLERLPNGSVVLRPSESDALLKKTGRIEDLFGCLAGKTNVRLTIEEINEGIIQGCVDEYEEGLKR